MASISVSKLGSVLFVSLLSLSTFATRAGAQKPAGVAAKAPDMRQLVRSVVDPLVDGPVDTDSRAYYAGEMLIVPLHAAFHQNDSDWQKHFAGHFQRLMQSTSALAGFNELSRLQYLYFASQFLVVAKATGRAELIPSGLPDYLYSELRATWLDRPAIQYAHAPFHGKRESIVYRLNLQNPAKSYYRAIMDVDFFLFAIAADLRTYGGTGEQQRAWQSTLDDVLSFAEKVCRQEIKPTDSGGWLLQPGAWADHPDFQYAGNARAVHGIHPAPVRNIAWDTSHFLRMPFWLTSLVNAYPQSSPQRDFYANLRRGLATQFFSKVLVPPSSDSPCYRLNNYMDGTNGVFRWAYGSLGADNGYGPYQASGALLIGSWEFMGTQQSKELYQRLSDSFPWPKECIELYLGPNSGGKPYTESQLDPNSNSMRLYHVLVYLAAQL